jgi:hypothetical protein
MQLELELKDPALKGFKRRIIEHVRANPMESECDIVDVVLGLQEILNEYHMIIREKYEHDLAEKEVMVQAFYDLITIFKDLDWIQTSIENKETHSFLRSRDGINYVDDHFLHSVERIFIRFDWVRENVLSQLKTHCWEYKEKVHSELLMELAVAKREREELRLELQTEKKVSRLHAYEQFLKELDEFEKSIVEEKRSMFDPSIQLRLIEKIEERKNLINKKIRDEGFEKLLPRLKYLDDVMKMVYG